MLYTQETLTRSQAAEILGISTASVGNWIRQGLISALGRDVTEKSVLELKKQIDSGRSNRLTQRANKTGARSVFIPDEQIESDGVKRLIELLTPFSGNDDLSVLLYLVALRLFEDNHDLEGFCWDRFIDDPDRYLNQVHFRRKNVKRVVLTELEQQLAGSEPLYKEKDRIRSIVKLLESAEFPDQVDLLGVLYQSLTIIGQKAARGAYYTPSSVTDQMLPEQIGSHQLCLDPCCGTGRFLLAFADRGALPEHITGYDIDPMAVFLAKVQLLIRFPEQDFPPGIFLKNPLIESPENNAFDIVVTNPPWGARYSKEDQDRIRSNFPELKSRESFSAFLVLATRICRPGGHVGYLVPETLCFTAVHNDIRDFLLATVDLIRIQHFGKPFKGVMSPVISLIFQVKNKAESLQDEPVMIQNRGIETSVSISRFLGNRKNIFDIHTSPEDERILKKLDSKPHVTLKSNADWALGIVTGDNKRFLSDHQGKFHEPIIQGKHIQPLFTDPPDKYIRFRPEQFQQTSKVEYYRAREKLVYRFVSSRMVFAYDTGGRLTLNSANILIPRIPGYSMKVLCLFLNSRLFNYYYRKRFHALKVLRGNVEHIPFPQLSRSESERFLALFEKIFAEKTGVDEAEQEILALYKLSQQEKDIVLSQ